MLAHQKTRVSGAAECGDVFGIMNAAFADAHHTIGEMLGEPQRRFERNFKGRKIPVVDADNLAARRDRDLQFPPAVHLDERSHSEPGRQFPEIANFPLAEDRRD